MSNPAQEEADRLFSNKSDSEPKTHPEDIRNSDIDSEDEKTHRSNIRSRREKVVDEDANSEDYDDDDDTDLARNMATLTTTRQTYTIPTTAHFANTGPKGVIADAQNYHRARRSTFRRTLTSISSSLPFTRPRTGVVDTKPPKAIRDGSQSGSDREIPTDEEDDDFMAQWREKRLAELQEQYSSSSKPYASYGSPPRNGPRKSYGTLKPVNAAGYLAAIEGAPPETTVVVLLYDPDETSSHYQKSREVEDELEMLAYKYTWVKFVKLHHEVAEVESMDVPAVLAYRGGDVYATISGAERDGLEDGLLGQGVLMKR